MTLRYRCSRGVRKRVVWPSLIESGVFLAANETETVEERTTIRKREISQSGFAYVTGAFARTDVERIVVVVRVSSDNTGRRINNVYSFDTWWQSTKTKISAALVACFNNNNNDDGDDDNTRSWRVRLCCCLRFQGPSVGVSLQADFRSRARRVQYNVLIQSVYVQIRREVCSRSRRSRVINR